MSATQLMACNANWLDTVNGDAPTQTLTSTSMNTLGQAWGGQMSNCIDYNYAHWYGYPIHYASNPARPIKLALSEVERLRKAAKADEKLKAILQKFTSQIEITVDFE